MTTEFAPSVLDVETICRLRDIAREIKPQVNPYPCDNCGTELYIIATTDAREVQPCPNCGAQFIDPDKFRHLLGDGGVLVITAS